MRKILPILLVSIVIVCAEGMWMNNKPVINDALKFPAQKSNVQTNTNSLNPQKEALSSIATDICEEKSKIELSPRELPIVNYSCEWTITLNHVACVGVTPVCIGTYPQGETLLWVSSGGLTGNADPNYILIYNLRTRTLVDSFLQAPTTLWGYRDMCFYNGYVYAGTEATLHKIDPVTHAVVGTYSVTGISGSVIRALTDNNVEDSLWTTNWAVPIYKVWNQGGAVRTVQATNTYSVYGLAYDPHGYVWGSCQNQPTADLVKYSYPGFTVLDYVRVTELLTGELAGGCEMWKDTFLLYLGQCTPNDKVFCLKLYGIGANDMKATSINAPSATLPYKKYYIQALAQNIGSSTQSAGVPVKMRITGPGYLYEDLNQSTSISLAQGDTQRITFSPQWQAPGVTGTYTIKIWTELAGDENPGNDTVTAQVEVTNWITYANFGGSAYYYPTLGGEKATFFVPQEFGVIPPVTVESIYAQFYGGPATGPSKDSVVKFKVYAGDLTTLLYESDTIRLPVVVGSWYTYTHGLPTPVPITGTSYLVSVVPQGDSHPMLLSDQEPLGRSIYGDTSGWYLNSSGEWHIASYVSWTPRNDDVGTDWIVEPTTMVSPSVAISPKAVIHNVGFNTQGGFSVTCLIDSSGSNIYTGTATGPSMLFGDTTTVTFSPTWTPGPAGAVYDITVYTGLGGDEYRYNDTIAYFTSSFVITNNIISNLTSAPPTIDGNIQTSEWSDAEKYDVSDVLGQEGVPYPAGSAYLYVKHDATNLYLGCDLPSASTLDDLDQLGVYLDDNNDGAWATDSSEGNYWVVHYPSADSVRYRALWWKSDTLKNWIYGSVFSPVSITTTSGHLQFECVIPIGTAKHQLNINPNGDTAGLWFFAADNPYGDRYAYWPTDMSSDTWTYPDAYGNLIFQLPPLDVGVTAVLAPSGTMYLGQSVPPQATVKNYGIATGTFPVIYTIYDGPDPIYLDTEFVSLTVGQELTVEFDPPFTPTYTGGPFDREVRTALPGDAYAGNDVMTPGGFMVELPPATSWTPGTAVPAAGDLKPGKLVKDGGSMVAVGPDVYAFPGNKSWQFYKYEPYVKGAWTVLESIPYGHKSTDPTKINKKKIGKGAALCYDGTGIIYATKGNSTTELWAYDILANTWAAKAFVPVPKALKGGTSIAYLGGKVYLLAGGQKKTDLVNFYVYDVATDVWTPLGLLTLGPNIKIWKDGACLTKLDGTLYALKSNDKYNPFFSYDVLSNTWTEFDSIPMLDSLAGKKKKVAVKDGGAMCAGGDAIYAIKGGGTIYFWKYTTGGGWTRSDSIPRLHKKSVAKTGAALTFCDNMVYLMKGNNTSELWSYGPVYDEKVTARTPVAGTYSAVMAEKTETALTFNLNATPNPFTGTTTIRYAVPTASRVSIKLYSANGRLIETIHDGYLSQGVYTKLLTTNNIARGIYFLRYEDNYNRAEIKVINQ